MTKNTKKEDNKEKIILITDKKRPESTINQCH